ncbi:MAG: helix-turn-helix domain-containing protein [Candidatus Azobacteroides sp.]|nr:helix-turn-helix domain-containing protein [Candidatus Azobacteroides sp.]
MELRLKEILKKRGKSISSFADDVGIAQANMSNIVNGKTMPSLDTINRIAESLNIPIADLFKSRDVFGFIKYRGEVYEINSIADIENLLEKIKEEK